LFIAPNFIASQLTDNWLQTFCYVPILGNQGIHTFLISFFFNPLDYLLLLFPVKPLHGKTSAKSSAEAHTKPYIRPNAHAEGSRVASGHSGE
jgi:hypothetical protein